jgi:beta-galactosidase/beta-glucuronidase
MGFLVWEEGIGWGNTAEHMGHPLFIEQQVEQTRLMVRNSFNHPSVIIFSFLNENFSGTDEGVAICRHTRISCRRRRYSDD